MPHFIIKDKIGDKDSNIFIEFSFHCIYRSDGELELNTEGNLYFDSGDCRITIKQVIAKINSEIITGYRKKNHGIYYFGLANYFFDQIPGLYSVNFKTEESESIYYATEMRKKE